VQTKAAPHPRGSSSRVGHCPSCLRRARSPIFLPSSSCLFPFPRLQSFVPTYPPLALTNPPITLLLATRFIPSYFKLSHPQSCLNPHALRATRVQVGPWYFAPFRTMCPVNALFHTRFQTQTVLHLVSHHCAITGTPAPSFLRTCSQSGSPTSGLFHRTYVSTSRLYLWIAEPSTFWLLTSFSVVRSLSPDH
jgi:hypothetical protein